MISFDTSGFLSGLAAVDRAISSPNLRGVGSRLVELFRENIRDQTLGLWAPLSGETVRQRLAAGFGSGPTLIRSGSLRDSIDVLSERGNEVEVGVENDRRAPILDSSRPFIGFDESISGSVVDEIFEPVADSIFGAF